MSLSKRYSDLSVKVMTAAKIVEKTLLSMQDTLSDLQTLQKDVSEELERKSENGEVESEDYLDGQAFSDIDLDFIHEKINGLLDEFADFSSTLSSIQFENL